MSVTIARKGSYYLPKKTIPRKYLTSKGFSKLYEWIQIEECPCVCVDLNEDFISLNSFSSSPERKFKVSIEEFKDQFSDCQIEDGFIVGLKKYPGGKIHLSEFDKRSEVKILEKKIQECILKSENQMMKQILGDKFWQLFCSQGAPYIKIDQYFKYKNGEIKLGKLEHFGNEIFNRSCRWSPSVNISYQEFKDSPSYPAPLGIRPKDFCLPSELMETVKELVRQILSFENVDTECFESLQLEESEKKHRCHWCHKIIDAKDYSSEYGSKDNFIEICHKDPNERFLKKNMYWGHGECNRRQGGYSEEDRIHDALNLLKNNDDYIEKFKQMNPFN